MQRELILLRHAKSAWPIGVRDRDRPLTARGQANATRAGEVLAAGKRLPDLILASPAERTTLTAQLVSAAMPSVPVGFEESIYDASWWEVLDVVRALDAAHSLVVLIGHNPAMEDLSSELAGRHSNPEALKRLRTKFPTCAMATLLSDESWPLWGTDGCQLTHFWTPREDDE